MDGLVASCSTWSTAESLLPHLLNLKESVSLAPNCKQEDDSSLSKKGNRQP